MTDTSRYFAADWDFDEERARLRLIEELNDPATTRRLSSLGLTSGWRCLELGAGAGSIACWLAARVGPSGQVVATDIDPRFLEDLKLPNLEVRRHDIRTDTLEREAYDLVHCRNLLVHLSDPEQMARRMVAALRPGGWLLAEEPDLTVMVAVSRDHPAADTFDSFLRRAYVHRSLGFAKSLPVLTDRLGLTECGHEVTSSIVRGGEPRARLHAQTVRGSRTNYLANGVLTERECERLDRALHDPAFAYLAHLSVAAWGRRP
jgi:SAM-dependent methyltransferase